MKELIFERLEEVSGGGQAEMCGLAVGGAIFFTGGWALLFAGGILAFCLTSDSQQ